MKNLLLIATLIATLFAIMTVGVMPNVSDLASVRAVAAESGDQTSQKATSELVSRDQRSNSDRKLSSGQRRGSKSEQPNTEQPNTEQPNTTGPDDGSECRPGEATPIPGASDRLAASAQQRAEGTGELDEHYPEQVDHDCPCGKDCTCTPFVCKNKDCDKNYLIMFTAKWCKPCRQMYPQIKEMRKDGYLVYVYDIDEYPDLKEQFQLTSVPVLVVMDKRKEVKRFVGLTEVSEITKFVVKEADQKPDQPNPDKYNFLP